MSDQYRCISHWAQIMNEITANPTRDPNTTRSIEKILALIHQKQFHSATKKINKLLKSSPSEDRAIMLKVLIHEEKADFEAALIECKKASAIAPNNLQYQLKEAHLLIQVNHFEEAKKTLYAYLAKTPGDRDALTMVAVVFKKLNEKAPQLITLLRLAGIHPLSSDQRQELFSLSAEIQIHSFSQEVINGFLAVLDYHDTAERSLACNLGNYTLAKYQKGQKDASIDLAEVIEDPLLIKTLPIIRLYHPAVEKFLTVLRSAILSAVLQSQQLNQKAATLISALALQNYLNEYVFYINDHEKEQLVNAYQLLEVQMQQADWTPYSSEAILLLVAMYDGLYESPMAAELLKHPLDTWPRSLQDIAEKTLFNIHNELEISQTIETLTAVTDEVSQEVQAQYEKNPYPRWNKMSVDTIKSIAHLICYFSPGIKDDLPAELFNSKTPMLVAGCGTGLHPISSAKRFPHTHVTAVDISRRSLAYATIKAKELKINNIDFFQADILALPDSIGKFHYIECCGVLHHMADPMEGWKNLLKFLHPGGVMKVAVYSTMARKDITIERNKIAALNMEPTASNIRLYRQALINQQPPSPVTSMFVDFYSLSECRDLLFHQHEQCYSWQEIKQCCETLNIDFLGLVDSTHISDAFLKRFPEEKTTRSFEKLEALEKENPYIFRSMYQFLVQKPLK